jgi:energy-coupling factor transport system ATP-binding protein
MPDALIKLENVSWRYARSESWALRNISIEFKPGELIAVMGAAGSGKSTLLKLCNGIIPHSHAGILQGIVTVDGTDTAASSVPELACKVGMALEDPDTQLFTARVRDEVAFGLENLLTPPAEIRKRVNWALETTGLSGFEDALPSTLSGGQKQRLAIAAALAMANKMLVLDDPASRLDPAGAREVFSLVQELKAGNSPFGRNNEKMAVIVALHDSEKAAAFAGKICVLVNGELAAFDVPEKIFSDTKLLEKSGIMPLDFSIKTAITTTNTNNNILINNESVNAHIDETKKILTRAVPSIAIDHVWYSWDTKKNALCDVNLTINENDFVAIAGQNGSGKSTLLKIIAGLVRPSQGTVFLRGKNAQDMSVSAIAREAGFVMQESDSQLFSSTVYEETAFALKKMKLPKDEVQRRVEASLDATGISALRDAFPPELTKGERARTVIAAILAMDPGIIILDEPTAGQDWRNSLWIMDIARDLHAAGRTIVFVTHTMPLAAWYARRVVVMKEGRVFIDGQPEDVFSRENELLKAGIIPPPQSFPVKQH